MQITVETAAPEVLAGYPNQRYYNRPTGQSVTSKCFDTRAEVRVFRSATHQDATLSLRLSPFGELAVHLSPAELRELGASLLSASVDIETHPHPSAAAPVRAETAAALTPPPVGQPWPEQGGLYAGIVRSEDGGPDQHLILAAALPAERLTWQGAIDWAKTVTVDAHADFSLPTRRESAALYATFFDEVGTGWHWTSTQPSRGDAWIQGFGGGSQGIIGKSYDGRARAVRRFNVQSLSSSS